MNGIEERKEEKEKREEGFNEHDFTRPFKNSWTK